MDPDDLLPNDSTFLGGVPPEPKEQTIAREKEKAATLQVIDGLKQAIIHFDERIAYRDTIGALNVNLLEEPELHQKKCEVNDMLKMALIEEKQLLEELLQAHSK